MNWNRMSRIAVGGLLILLSGCGGGSSTQPNPTPTPTPPGPWTFPASSKFAVTLYADSSTYAIGDSFDVKVVAYNLTNVFGATFQVNYPASQLNVGRVVYNSTPIVTPNLELPGRVEADSNRVSFGFTFLRGSHHAFNGSAVLARLRCLGTAAGTAKFTLARANLAIQDSTGSAIPNFSNLEVDSLSVTVHTH